MAREFKTEDGRTYTIALTGRRGRALESFWAGKATSRDTLSALRGVLPSSAPAEPEKPADDDKGKD